VVEDKNMTATEAQRRHVRFVRNPQPDDYGHRKFRLWRDCPECKRVLSGLDVTVDGKPV
jgi:hypothetical protein